MRHVAHPPASRPVTGPAGPRSTSARVHSGRAPRRPRAEPPHAADEGTRESGFAAVTHKAALCAPPSGEPGLQRTSRRAAARRKPASRGALDITEGYVASRIPLVRSTTVPTHGTSYRAGRNLVRVAAHGPGSVPVRLERREYSNGHEGNPRARFEPGRRHI